MNNIVDGILNTIFNRKDWLDAGVEYLNSRGIDQSLTQYLCPATVGADVADFDHLKYFLPPYVFVDCLFIPIGNFLDNTKIEGFDIRYIGNDPSRKKYVKVKRNADSFLVLMTKEPEAIQEDEPILVVEGFFDLEVLRFLDVPIVAALTTKSDLKWLYFLNSLSSKVFFLYDNDLTGRAAIKRIRERVEPFDTLASNFRPIVYRGEDPNTVVYKLGQEYIKTMILSQINIG